MPPKSVKKIAAATASSSRPRLARGAKVKKPTLDNVAPPPPPPKKKAARPKERPSSSTPEAEAEGDDIDAAHIKPPSTSNSKPKPTPEKKTPKTTAKKITKKPTSQPRT
ncbi:uncharacterized protein LY89DRAFT_682151 [Mollisia scopiformis]|uniref:Uncharacterized protein n=1 Tax=Mollisia scopiformis TaxID=149040 RepID=A0A194XKV9_MOLSC|nr:uncharacterized protein LY89DRAFT_682151 [Mollisia scopiformis]KUJ20412.1 hypothetical protein LY89DRAFT_682151 [Mollisia scopiformis]